MPLIRRDFSGDAVSTTLVGSISSGSTTWDIADPTGWPLGTNGPFFAVFNRQFGSTNADGSGAEEKVLVTSRTGTTITLADPSDRGADGTTAQAWAAPTSFDHCYSATDADEANQAAAGTLGIVQGKGDLLTGGAANRLQRTAAGADDELVIFDSSQPGGVRTGSLPDGAVSSSTMFAAGVVDTAALEDSSVTVAKLADLVHTGVEIDALTGMVVGQHVWQSDTTTARPFAGVYWWDGVAWRQPWDQPWGVLLKTVATTNQGPFAVTTDLNSLSGTWTVVAHRLYEVSFFGQLQNDTANDTGRLEIYSNTLSRPLVYGDIPLTVAGFPGSTQMRYVGSTLTDLTAGTHSIKCRALQNHLGNLTFVATGSQASLVVKDIGPAGAFV